VVTNDPLIARSWDPWCRVAGVPLSCTTWDEISAKPDKHGLILTGEEHAHEVSDTAPVLVVRGLRDHGTPSSSHGRVRPMIVEPVASDDIRATLYTGPDLGQVTADEHPISSEIDTLTVLIVDDDTNNLVFQQKLLETYGHQITIAGTGETAITALRNGSFDAAILDIEMPDMNGWELAELIRSGAAGEAGKSLPLVALSGHAAPEIAARAQNIGFDEVLTKPAQVETVIQVLRTAVGGRSPRPRPTPRPQSRAFPLQKYARRFKMATPVGRNEWWRSSDSTRFPAAWRNSYSVFCWRFDETTLMQSTV